MQAKKLIAALGRASAPMAIYVTGHGVATPWGAAAGMADASVNRPLTTGTPLRIASNTKMFVAATVLRLWEQGGIDLDASVASSATPTLVSVLKARGYRTELITVRQLMSHSAGLYDHGDDPRFIQTVLSDPCHQWTREEQIRLSAQYAGPQCEPGSRFQYSDTGYVLLGDIIERIAGENLGTVVRRELRFEELGLHSLWWELFEPHPSHIEARARQFLDDVDMTDASATMDLFGGGGLVMSARDLASFAKDLFEGRVFDDPQTLAEMLRKGPHDDADKYRLGVSVSKINGNVCYSHAGFWGTVVYYSPQQGVAVSGFTTVRNARPELVSIVERVISAPENQTTFLSEPRGLLR